MNHLCPACAKTFTQKEVIRTNEMLPGRKYFGWNSCNHFCPHCNALLQYIKPVHQVFIDGGLLVLLVVFAFTVAPGTTILRSPTVAEVTLSTAALVLIFVRHHLGKTRGRYVLA